ncbi:MAG: protease HtpX [Fimbriimonadaceae bacterium]|nr:protease HtpX [Fimbriimonadaceae bacterium]
MKRILLLIGTNLLVMTTITAVVYLTGLHRYTSAYGINLPTLAVFSLVVGFGGSFVSLLISKWMAKTVMGVQVIDPARPGGPEGAWLVQTVHDAARRAGLEKMPEVGVFDSPEMNAFATGPGRNNSLVAVSTGILQHMDRGAAAAVIGHEVAHVANGDMVTMTLLQGIVNTFVVFLARVLATVVGAGDRDRSGMVYFLTVMVFQTVLTLLGSMVVMAFSRWREFRADAGGAQLEGRENMIRALQTLKQNQGLPYRRAESMATMQIYGRGGLTKLFMSHPPLDDRIAALQAAK